MYLKLSICILCTVSINVAICQMDSIHYKQLLKDTFYICCFDHARIYAFENFALENLEIVTWSTGEINDTILVSDEGIIILYAIRSDTIFYDSALVLPCEGPELIKRIICSADLPLQISELGILSGQSIVINDQEVDVIHQGDYLENTWIPILIDNTCDSVCNDCQRQDSIFILSNTILKFENGGLEAEYYNVCRNDTMFRITPNIAPGSFICTTCLGEINTPEFFDFNPFESDPGTHVLEYTTVVESCIISSQVIINLVSPRSAEIIGLLEDFICRNSPPIVCDFLPSDGEYEFNGEPSADGIIYPELFSNQVDSILVNYTARDDQGCFVDTFKNYELRLPPLVAFVPLNSKYCSNDPPVTLFGLPLEGIYTWETGDTLDGDVIVFTNLLSGTHTITYEASDNYCFNSQTQHFTLYEPPDAKIINTITTLCTNDSPVPIWTTLPPGDFSPDLFDSGVIYPDTSILGPNTIIFSVEDPITGCIGKDEKIFTVIDTPFILLKDPIYTCDPYTLTLFNFSTSNSEISSYWELTGNSFVENQTFFYYYFGSPGDKPIKLQVTNQEGCISQTTLSAFVPPINNSFITLADSVAETQDSIVFVSGSTTSLVSTIWLMGDGTVLSDSIVQHSYFEEGIYNILLNTIDQYGCTDTVRSRVLIKDPLDIHFQLINLFPNPTRDVIHGEFYTPVEANISVGIFSLDGLSRHTFHLLDGILFNAGRHFFELNVSDLPQGMYVLQFLYNNENLNGPYPFEQGELIYEDLKHLTYLKFIKL